MRHIFITLLFVVAAFGAIIAGITVYGVYFEQPFLYYQNLPFPATLKTIAPGETEPIEVERCSRSDKPETYQTTRRLVHVPKPDEKRLPDIILESKEVDILPGCHREVSSLNMAPPSTPSGTWIAKGWALVNGLVIVHKIKWYSEPFEVVRKVKT